jgi:hypothetical protein
MASIHKHSLFSFNQSSSVMSLMSKSWHIMCKLETGESLWSERTKIASLFGIYRVVASLFQAEQSGHGNAKWVPQNIWFSSISDRLDLRRFTCNISLCRFRASVECVNCETPTREQKHSAWILALMQAAWRGHSPAPNQRTGLLPMGPMLRRIPISK